MTTTPDGPAPARWVAIWGEGELARAVALQLRDLRPEVVDREGHPSAPGAVRVIVACGTRIGDEERDAIGALARTSPLATIVVVTRMTGENIRGLSAFPGIVGHIVGLDEVGTELWPQVNALLTRHYLDRAAIRLAQVLNLPPAVSRFLQRTWRTEPPPVSVSEAARDARTRLSTLRDRWPFDAPPRAFVEWALVGRTVTERQKGQSWARAAFRVRASRRRLERIVGRRLQCGLAQLEARGLDRVEFEFHEWIASRVLGDGPLRLNW